MIAVVTLINLSPSKPKKNNSKMCKRLTTQKAKVLL